LISNLAITSRNISNHINDFTSFHLTKSIHSPIKVIHSSMFAAKPDSDFAVATAVGDNPNWTQVNSLEAKKQPTRCRDPLFAVLLYANIAAIVGVAIKYGANPFTAENPVNDVDDDTNIDLDYTGVLYTCLSLAGFAVVFSAIMLQIMVCIPGILIKIALLFNVGTCNIYIYT
jgi:hypothetical protein